MIARFRERGANSPLALEVPTIAPCIRSPRTSSDWPRPSSFPYPPVLNGPRPPRRTRPWASLPATPLCPRSQPAATAARGLVGSITPAVPMWCGSKSSTQAAPRSSPPASWSAANRKAPRSSIGTWSMTEPVVACWPSPMCARQEILTPMRTASMLPARLCGVRTVSRCRQTTTTRPTRPSRAWRMVPLWWRGRTSPALAPERSACKSWTPKAHRNSRRKLWR